MQCNTKNDGMNTHSVSLLISEHGSIQLALSQMEIILLCIHSVMLIKSDAGDMTEEAHSLRRHVSGGLALTE